MNSTENIASERGKLKKLLWEKIDCSDDEGRYTDDQYDSLIETINDLVEYTPIAEPINEQEKVASPWRSKFASFGPKHTAGKPIVHDTNMGLQSFNRFPKVPMRVLDISQEVEHKTKAYNNVSTIQNPDGSVRADLIIYGRYSRNEENPKRYMVDFHGAALVGHNGISDEDLRIAFGMEQEQELKVSFSVTKLHSDIVYCDDTMRINFGKLGGIYVLERIDPPGRSVSFD